jgi:hypothetical protein
MQTYDVLQAQMSVGATAKRRRMTRQAAEHPLTPQGIIARI